MSGLEVSFDLLSSKPVKMSMTLTNPWTEIPPSSFLRLSSMKSVTLSLAVDGLVSYKYFFHIFV